MVSTECVFNLISDDELQLISDRNRLSFFLSDVTITMINGYSRVTGSPVAKCKLAERGILERLYHYQGGVIGHVLSAYGLKLYRVIKQMDKEGGKKDA